jgi:hypothetical protein
LRGVSKDGRMLRFETAQGRLLTMREVLSPPRRHADVMGGVEHLRLAGFKTVRGEYILRRAFGHSGKARVAAG